MQRIELQYRNAITNEDAPGNRDWRELTVFYPAGWRRQARGLRVGRLVSARPCEQQPFRLWSVEWQRMQFCQSAETQLRCSTTAAQGRRETLFLLPGNLM